MRRFQGERIESIMNKLNLPDEENRAINGYKEHRKSSSTS